MLRMVGTKVQPMAVYHVQDGEGTLIAHGSCPYARYSHCGLRIMRI